MTAPHWDFSAAVDDLLRIHDDLPTGPPPITHPAPRPLPPARQDAASVARRAEWLRALARATRGAA